MLGKAGSVWVEFGEVGRVCLSLSEVLCGWLRLSKVG